MGVLPRYALYQQFLGCLLFLISGQQYFASFTIPTGLGLAIIAILSDFSPHHIYANLLNMLVKLHYLYPHYIL
jgi:hypothetical protein